MCIRDREQPASHTGLSGPKECSDARNVPFTVAAFASGHLDTQSGDLARSARGTASGVRHRCTAPHPSRPDSRSPGRTFGRAHRWTPNLAEPGVHQRSPTPAWHGVQSTPGCTPSALRLTRRASGGPSGRLPACQRTLRGRACYAQAPMRGGPDAGPLRTPLQTSTAAGRVALTHRSCRHPRALHSNARPTASAARVCGIAHGR